MGCPSHCTIGDNLVFSICTHDADTGALTDASAVTYRVYEDETATAILNGTMAVLDTANTTGFYTELIAVTTANGFEAGKTYTIYIEATVDGVTGGISFAFKAEAVSLKTIDTLLDKFAPVIIGTVTGARTGTEVFVYGGVTVTSENDADGNRTAVTIT